MNTTQPILISGIHRSGSTWIGKVISFAPKIKYISEPFENSLKRKRSPIKHMYQFVDKDSDDPIIYSYIQKFKKATVYQLLDRLGTYKGEISFSAFRSFFQSNHIRLGGRPLFKDPLAIFAAEWYYYQFNAKIIIIIRHPAAFIMSLLDADWNFDFNHFARQEKLIDTYLSKYKDEILQFSHNPRPIIDSGILLWNCVYSCVNYYKYKHKDDWLFIRHEDVSIDPFNSFEKIFTFLEEPVTDKVLQTIIRSTTAKDDTCFKRDSIHNSVKWKRRLTLEQIQKIKTGTSLVSSQFYSEKDWEM